MTAGDHTERDILRQLQDGLPDDYTVFHHLHWANARPQGDQHGELDMVVMNRAGDLAALEVKAGELDLGPHGMFKRYGAAFKDVGYQVQRQFNKLQASATGTSAFSTSWFCPTSRLTMTRRASASRESGSLMRATAKTCRLASVAT